MNTYEYVYNVGLLDDLHNYFPAFLYDSGRFQTPAQVFHYLRTELHSRFNLPAHGARLAGFTPARQATPLQTPVQTPQQTPLQAPPQIQRAPRSGLDQLGLASALLGLLDLSGNNFLADGSYFYMQPAAIPNPAFLEPVLVRPSAEVLLANTTLIVGTEAPENSSCAICQDSITETDNCRKLTPCSHIYHRTCIDQWFETNVHCPTCRHDIRVSTTTPTS
jgi:hypothetical protein